MRIFIFENGIDSPPKEYSRYLIYPYSYERCHDESLAAASVVLKNTPAELTFAPGAFVFVGDGDYTSSDMDQWVLVSTSRDTNHATKRHTHTLYLCDPTKMLERYVLGNKTFTRSTVKSMDYIAMIPPVKIDSDESNIGANFEYLFAYNQPYMESPYYENGITLHAYSYLFPNVEDGLIAEASIRVDRNNSRYCLYKFDLFEHTATVIDQNGNETTEGYSFAEWKALRRSITVPLGSSLRIIYSFNNNEVGNERTLTYYVAVVDPNAPTKGNINLLQACQVAADVAQLENESVAPMFSVRAIGDIAARELAQDVTDTDLSGATLREAIDSIAGVANCFCRYKLEYSTDSGRFNHIIELYPIHSNEYANIAPLGFPVLQKMSDSIEGACSELDGTVSNLINMSEGGTISEPTDYAYISLRSETVRITENNCIIPTAHPIYKFVSLQIAYKDGNDSYEADISQYVYEDTEYGMLSSYDPVYPNSKAYALKYTRGKQNITELSFVQENALSVILERASMVNICNVAFGRNFAGFGTTDGMLKYPNLSFRITYVPVTETRLRQAKPFVADHINRNVICYNQSARSIDSVRYGRNMAGMVDRTGQAEKSLVYKVRKSVSIPDVGDKYDDEYIVTKIAVQELPNYKTVQLDLSRYFNRLNPFIGINSELRLFEISENGFVDRHVVYEDYCIISDAVHSPKQKPLITASGLSGFMYSVAGAEATGTHHPQLAIVQGYSVLEGELNKVALPVTAYGLGRSIVFSFGYQDNYSAGDRSVNPGEYGDMYRLKQAVPYSDNFGEIDLLRFALVRRNRTGELDSNDLPLETSGADFSEMFDTGTNMRLRLRKDGRECIHVSYQIHFVTDKNWFVSPAFAEEMKMITRRSSVASQSISVYALSYRLSASDTCIDLTKATKQKYITNMGTSNFSLQINTAKTAVEQNPLVFGEYANQNRFGANGQAWAVAYEDGRLLFGANQEITAGVTALPNINFTFTHKL